MSFFLHLLAMYLGGAPLYAQTVGANSSELLSQGPGAESAALAGTTVSTIHDPTALYWNPAGLTGAGGMVSGEHLFLFGGARYDFIGLSVPSSVGSFGIGALQLDRDNIVARQSIDDPGTTVSNTQSDYMAAYAHTLGRYFSVGSAINVLDFNIDGYSDRGWGLDLGGQGNYPQDDFFGIPRVIWTAGAAIKNLIEPKLTLMDDSESYPREMRVGAGFSFQTASRALASGVIEHDRASVLIAAERTDGDPEIYPSIGLAYDYDGVLSARLGYDGNVSAGVGLRTLDGRFRLDYSMENKPLTINNRFTISYQFLEPKTKPKQENYSEAIDPEYDQARAQAESLAQENFAAGESSFKGQDYKAAQESFRIATLLMPGDKEKAQSYRRAQEAYRRDQIRQLSTDATLSPQASEEEKAYINIAELLDLQADNKAELSALSQRVLPRIPDYLAQQEFDAHAKAARQLLALGHVSEARALADTLDVIVSSSSTVALEALKEEIAAKGAAIRQSFKEIPQLGRLDVTAINAALALRRAFPDDPQAQKGADEVLTRYRSENPLSIRERFYVLKLYYLAAAHYARRATDDARLGADLLKEILRRDPADLDADTLLDAMAREGLAPR